MDIYGLIKRTAFGLTAVAAGILVLNGTVFGDARDDRAGNNRTDEWRTANVRDACVADMDRASTDLSGPQPQPGARNVDPRDIDRAATMTGALHCYVVSYPEAVCEPHNRAFIAAYVRRYLDHRTQMLRIAAAYGEDEKQAVEQMWDSRLNRDIEAALVRDFNGGRLIRWDFGWSLPAALAPIMARTDGVAPACTAVGPNMAMLDTAKM